MAGRTPETRLPASSDVRIVGIERQVDDRHGVKDFPGSGLIGPCLKPREAGTVICSRSLESVDPINRWCAHNSDLQMTSV